MKYVMWLKDAALADKSVVGYKAWSLSKLKENHVNVPKGFVLTSDAVEKLLFDLGLLDKIKNLCSLGQSSGDWSRCSGQLQRIFSALKFTEGFSEDIEDYYQLLGVGESGGVAQGLVGGENPIVAVRLSSAFANVSSSAKLSVSGAEVVKLGVLEMLSSYYSLENCQRHLGNGFPALLVQKMVFGSKSGSLFTKHPVTGDSSYVIEAVQGLGTMLLGGDVVCDNYVINPNSRSVVSREICEQNFADVFFEGSIVRKEVPAYDRNSQALTDRECLEVSRQGQKIVGLLGNDVRVSFSCAGDSVFVVTALPMVEEEIKQNQVFTSVVTGAPVIAGAVSSGSEVFDSEDGLVLDGELPGMESSVASGVEGSVGVVDSVDGNSDMIKSFEALGDRLEQESDVAKLQELEASLESIDDSGGEVGVSNSSVVILGVDSGVSDDSRDLEGSGSLDESARAFEMEAFEKNDSSSVPRGTGGKSFEKLLLDKKEQRSSNFEKGGKRKDMFFKQKKRKKGKFGKFVY